MLLREKHAFVCKSFIIMLSYYDDLQDLDTYTWYDELTGKKAKSGYLRLLKLHKKYCNIKWREKQKKINKFRIKKNLYFVSLRNNLKKNKKDD